VTVTVWALLQFEVVNVNVVGDTVTVESDEVRPTVTEEVGADPSLTV
jgi:hypothetical protein